MAGKVTKAKWEGSAADKKMDKGKPKGWEGSAEDLALDKKGMAKANAKRGKKR